MSELHATNSEDENKLIVVGALRSLAETPMLTHVISTFGETPTWYGWAYLYVEAFSTHDDEMQLKEVRRVVSDAICRQMGVMKMSDAKIFLKQYVANLGLDFRDDRKSQLLHSYSKYVSLLQCAQTMETFWALHADTPYSEVWW
jgi:hypothetical protein